MSDNPPNQPRPDLGPPIQWTDAELDAMSEITPADIEAAKRLWRKSAPKKYKNLPDAKPEEKVVNGE